MATSKRKLDEIARRVERVWGPDAVEQGTGSSDWAYRFTPPGNGKADVRRVQLHNTPSDGNWEKAFWHAMNSQGFSDDEAKLAEAEETERQNRIIADRERTANIPIITSSDPVSRFAGSLVAQPANYAWILSPHKFAEFQRCLISPDLARVILENNNPKNRPIRQSRVDYWVEVMARNGWSYTHQGIAFDTNANLQDGQHRLTAAAKANFTLDIGVSVGMPVENFQIVDNGAIRTGSDVAHIAGYTDYTNTVAQAARWLYLYYTYSTELRVGIKHRMSNEALVRAINKFGPPLLEAVEAAHRFKKTRIAPPLNNGVFAAGLYLIGHADASGKYVEKFLEGFIYGTGLEMNDPREALRRYYANMRANARGRVTGEIQFGIFIKAWNDFVSNNNRQFFVLRTEEAFPLVKSINL